jgi:hypothetical protein
MISCEAQRGGGELGGARTPLCRTLTWFEHVGSCEVHQVGGEVWRAGRFGSPL